MYPIQSRKDVSILHVPDDSESSYNSNKTRKRQSIWRHWNRLSSLQRSIICIMLISGGISLLYIVPAIYQDSKVEVKNVDIIKEKHSNDDETLRDVEILPKLPKLPQLVTIVRSPLQKADKFAENAVKSVRLKAWLQQKNMTKIGHQRNIPKPRLEKTAYKFSGPTNPRMEAVAAAFRHSWDAYRKFAWGHDELLPVSRSYSEWFGVGLTLIDSLDTMYIMGFQDEFKVARDWVAYNLTLDVDRDVNLFECTIRILGGLLSTYHLSNDDIFLKKAQELGDRLMPAFKSGSAVPYSDVNLHTHSAHAPRWGPDSSTSEVTTIQLEFTDLSRQVNDPKYEDAVNSITNHVHSLYKKDGLVPIFINANSGQFRASSTITVGARGDSYYEYLLKMWLQTGKEIAREDFEKAIYGMKRYLMRESEPSKLLYIGEMIGGTSFSPKMDHLVCFIGGSLALAAKNGFPQEFLDLGVRITETCFEMYRRMPTGLSPEIVHFNTIPGAKEDLIVKPADSHNLQRPETVESLFYLYRLTGNKTYQDMGWDIFQAFEKYTKLANGYSSIGNVQNPANPQYKNKMESFWLGETLKYLYLLFTDDFDVISLDEFIFTTEGHPLPIYS